MRYAQHTARGFSLLEVIVAFAIAALALSTLSQIFGQGARNLALSRDYASAVSIADGLLAEYGETNDASVRKISETLELYRWQVQLQPYVDIPIEADTTGSKQKPPGSAAQLLRIDVDVEWERYGKTRVVSVSSLRLVDGERNARPL